MKKFIACLLVVSLLFSVSASAAGVDAYTVDEDVTVFSMLAANASDYAVMPLSSSWSTELGALNSIDDAVWDIKSDVSLMEGYLQSIDSDIELNLTDMRLDLGQIQLDVDSLEDFLTSTNTASSLYATLVKANSSVVSVLDDLLDELEVTHSDSNSRLSTINSSLNTLLTLPTGQQYLNLSGNVYESSSNVNLTSIVRHGFMGLNSNLMSALVDTLSEPEKLSINGTQINATKLSSLDLVSINRAGFLGLRSLIAGSESDNVYDGSITSNENVSTSFSATGLGPMLNKWLGAVQLDTGRLSYMFASPADLQAKKDSESTTQAVADSFLDPDSDASIKLGDVGALKDASAQVQQLGQTGVTPGQAFEQLGNADLFAFFTEQASNDLDSRVSTYSRDPSDRIVTNYYEQSRAEFFDLIGKEE